jgi:hypothetical protein
MESTKLRAAVLDAIKDLETVQQRFVDLLSELDGDAIQVPRQGRWTKPMLKQLWAEVDHLIGIRTLFGQTAACKGKPVTFTHLLRESHLPEQQQRNEHARMSRVAAELFGEKKWPIENWQGSPSSETGKAEMIYRMGPTVAQWWNEICDEEDDF